MNRLLFLPILLLITRVFSQCPTGLKVDETEYNNTSTYPDLVIGKLPSSTSLEPYCPKPATQLDNLTSAGWSSAYYAMTILHAIEMGISGQDQVTKEAFSPTYSHLIVQGTEGLRCDFPISIKESLDVLVSKGVPKFYDYPYFCPDEANSGLELHPLSGYYRLFSSYDTENEILTKIKAVLSQGLPVIIGLKTSTSFCDAGAIWNPLGTSDENTALHAICMIGYDDLAYGGSFELVNSWGSQWGDGGFIHVPYDDLIPRIVEGYIPYLLPEHQELYLNVIPQLSSGGQMPVEQIENNRYRFVQTYGPGNRFNFRISTNFKGYLYLYYFNDKDESAVLFPDRDNMTSEVLALKMSEIAIPSQDRFLQLDTNPGIENLVFIMSQQKLDPEQIKLVAKAEYPNFDYKNEPAISGSIDAKNPYTAIWMELSHQ